MYKVWRIFCRSWFFNKCKSGFELGVFLNVPILIRMRMAYDVVLDLGKAAYRQKCQKEYTAKWNTLSKSEFFYIIKKRRYHLNGEEETEMVNFMTPNNITQLWSDLHKNHKTREFLGYLHQTTKYYVVIIKGTSTKVKFIS